MKFYVPSQFYFVNNTRLSSYNKQKYKVVVFSACFLVCLMSIFVPRIRPGNLFDYLKRMASPPPRKVSSSSSNKSSKDDGTPFRILLQMGFPKHRALKALAATGNRSVQLASDWLLTHVNDAFIDAYEPREYILYASPTGPLLAQLLEFWDKSKAMCGWNGAHNFPPHITLVSFFKAPDETSLQLAKAVKHVVESAGDPPAYPLKLEPYASHNFMGLFVSEEHADYLKKIALQYVKQVSSALGVSVDTYEQLNTLETCFPWCAVPQEKTIKYVTVSLEAQVKSLHITLAYRFDSAAYAPLQALAKELRPQTCPGWELRLYSRDPRFANHEVYKVIKSYTTNTSDELELVLGDYIYIDRKDLDASVDGWVQGTSWLTGVSGYLPAMYTKRTAESDAWTLHRAISLGNHNDCKSESDSNTDGEMSHPHEDAAKMGLEKSEETYKEWDKYWKAVEDDGNVGFVNLTHGNHHDWKSSTKRTCGDNEVVKDASGNATKSKDSERRWIFALRHGERIDLTYGQWTPYCFDEHGKYVRKDLNMPLTLGERAGGADSYARDTPLTRVGRLQAYLVGEGLRLAGVRVRRVLASAALRCVETAHEFLLGLQADPSVKVQVEPGLFEYKMWHAARGMAPFMTPLELHNAGINVDLDYKPVVDLDVSTPETLEECYARNEKIIRDAFKEHEKEGGNIVFVGHAATLDMMTISLTRLFSDKKEFPPYQINRNLLRVPYCALGAMRDKPLEIVCPPCPPSINSSSGRFDWKMLQDITDNNV